MEVSAGMYNIRACERGFEEAQSEVSRFSVECAISEGYTVLDFHMGDRRYPIDNVQLKAIGEEPDVIRYEIKRTLQSL